MKSTSFLHNFLFMFVLLMSLSTACSQDSIEIREEIQVFNPNMLKAYPYSPTGAPYLIDIKIERGVDNSYYLVSTIDFLEESYIASPFSIHDYTGKFRSEVFENEHLELGELTSDSAKPSKPQVFTHAEPADWIKEKTVFRQRISLNTANDFLVGGKLSFTIEPNCTFEIIPFAISNKSGRLQVEPDRC
jgi:hypothetical protein